MKRTSRRPKRNSKRAAGSTYARLQKELVKAEAARGKYIPRPGVHYSWFPAHEFNQAIQDKRDFAVWWREKALGLGPDVEARTEGVLMGDAEREFTVFSVDGVDLLAIATRAGSNFIYRVVDLATEGEPSFKAWARKNLRRWL